MARQRMILLNKQLVQAVLRLILKGIQDHQIPTKDHLDSLWYLYYSLGSRDPKRQNRSFSQDFCERWADQLAQLASQAIELINTSTAEFIDQKAPQLKPQDRQSAIIQTHELIRQRTVEQLLDWMTDPAGFNLDRALKNRPHGVWLWLGGVAVSVAGGAVAFHYLKNKKDQCQNDNDSK